ncbi:MAG: hypothetical protein KBC30_04680 [Planctomycetes bacterium]|jgi:hypothetical protein|nr:hypothetical protein [Planctomycetota bacterium]
MKLYIKTYIKDIIIGIMLICISIGVFYGFLVLDSYLGLAKGEFLNFLLHTLNLPPLFSAIILIIGFLFLVVALAKMKKLKYFLENGIHTKAVITKLYPLRTMTFLFTREKKPIESKDESPSFIFFYSIQYQFQNENGQIITINEDISDKTLKYLCVGSKIHILYDPNDEKKAMICPWWDQWIANNELDTYPKFLTDVPTSPIVGKQRHIPFFHFFSISMLIQILVAFSIIAIQEGLGNVPTWICFIGYGIGFLLLAIVCFTLRKEQNFFEYAVRTVALVQSARIIKRIVVIEYQFLSSTEDNIFPGLCKLEGTPENSQLQQGSEIEILYHTQRPYQSRPFTPEYEKYLHYNE